MAPITHIESEADYEKATASLSGFLDIGRNNASIPYICLRPWLAIKSELMKLSMNLSDNHRKQGKSTDRATKDELLVPTCVPVKARDILSKAKLPLKRSNIFDAAREGFFALPSLFSQEYKRGP